MENIIKVLIYVLMILQIIIGSVFIIGEVKSGEGKIKLYIIRELNLVTALIFFIISAENPHASLTETGYVILCIGETVIIIGEFFCIRDCCISKRNRRIFELYDEDIEETDWEEEYEKIIKYKEKLGYMRHELVKDISVFEAGTIEDKNINKKLNNLKRQLQGVTEVIYCENKIVYAVIEKKLSDIIEREIRVETDIKLINVSDSLLNEVCMIIWLLIENVAGRLHRENEIYIKLSERKTKSREVYISYYIETDKDNVRLSAIKKSMEMDLLKELMNKTDGSIIVLKKGGKVVETGIFLGGGRNGMKRKLLLCMSIEILCFVYVIIQIAKKENRDILPAAIFLVGAIILLYVYALTADIQSHNRIIDKDKFVKTQLKKANIEIIKVMQMKEKYLIEQMRILNEEILKSHAVNGDRNRGEILKLLFASRKRYAESINIALEIKWNEKDLQSKFSLYECKIDIWDMVHIILNLIDNALEAADKNTEENRWIKLKGIIDNHYAFIEVLNPYNGELKIVNGEIKTTKEDEKNHGMGLKIVRKTAEKYGMAMDVSTCDNIFKVRIAGCF